MIGTLSAMLSRRGRSVGLTVLSAGLVLVAGACADTDAGPSAPTVSIRPESYQRRPAVTLPGDSATPATAAADGTTDQFQNYTVGADEYPSTIADKFEISLDELVTFNDWTLVNGQVPEFEGEGQEIRIPPGARLIDPDAPETTDAPEPEPEPEAGTEPEAETETSATGSADIPPTSLGDSCTPGRYTVEAGDFPIGVADNFDVTPEALASANSATAGYSAFYPGLEIIIPPATDCPAEQP